MGNLFEYETATGKLRILSPAGLVLAELSMIEQARVVNMVLSMSIANASGQQVPPFVVVPYPGATPPMRAVATTEPITNPVAHGQHETPKD